MPVGLGSLGLHQNEQSRARVQHTDDISPASQGDIVLRGWTTETSGVVTIFQSRFNSALAHDDLDDGGEGLGFGLREQHHAELKARENLRIGTQLGRSLSAAVGTIRRGTGPDARMNLAVAVDRGRVAKMVLHNCIAEALAESTDRNTAFGPGPFLPAAAGSRTGIDAAQSVRVHERSRYRESEYRDERRKRP